MYQISITLPDTQLVAIGTPYDFGKSIRWEFFAQDNDTGKKVKATMTNTEMMQCLKHELSKFN